MSYLIYMLLAIIHYSWLTGIFMLPLLSDTLTTVTGTLRSITPKVLDLILFDIMSPR